MASKKPAKKKKVTLTFQWEPGKDVIVAGSFNDWAIDPADKGQAKKVKKLKEDNKIQGTYSINMFLTPGDHEYKFFTGEQWHADPQAENKTPNIFGTYNSVLEIS